jgi:hypothetical protein
MFRLIAIAGTAIALSGCVAAPGYGYYDPGYYDGYGGAYPPAYEYGTIGIWGGGGYDHYHHGWGHGGWGHGGWGHGGWGHGGWGHGGGDWHGGGGGHGGPGH